MRAIEINSKTDKKGNLKIDSQLNKINSTVKVLILYDDNADNDEEKIWMKSISTNPVFDFLNDDSEDIYSINDGEPFDD